jgi:hypothetical protein
MDWLFIVVMQYFDLSGLNPAVLALSVTFVCGIAALVAYNCVESHLNFATQRMMRRYLPRAQGAK